MIKPQGKCVVCGKRVHYKPNTEVPAEPIHTKPCLEERNIAKLEIQEAVLMAGGKPVRNLDWLRAR